MTIDPVKYPLAVRAFADTLPEINFGQLSTNSHIVQTVDRLAAEVDAVFCTFSHARRDRILATRVLETKAAALLAADQENRMVDFTSLCDRLSADYGDKVATSLRLFFLTLKPSSPTGLPRKPPGPKR